MSEQKFHIVANDGMATEADEMENFPSEELAQAEIVCLGIQETHHVAAGGIEDSDPTPVFGTGKETV